MDLGSCGKKGNQEIMQIALLLLEATGKHLMISRDVGTVSLDLPHF